MQVTLPYSKSWAIGTIVVLVILYAVGLYGLTDPDLRELFIALTPFNLAASAAIVLGFQKKWKRKFVIFLLSIFVAGMLVEIIGVNTGFPFGDYEYGETLGIKMFGVPLLIGVNWVMLIYCTGVIGRKIPVPKIAKAFIGAVLMVIMDVALEPVAIEYDFWNWAGSEVPISNYVAWFVISFMMLIAFHLERFRKSNLVAPSLYIIMLIFFTVLNYLI